MERIDAGYRDYALLNEINRKSVKKFVLGGDDAFFQELYNTAIEELKHDYETHCQEHRGWCPFPEKYKQPTFEEWIRYMGGENFIRSYVNKYKEALKDNATQVEYEAEY